MNENVIAALDRLERKGYLNSDERMRIEERAKEDMPFIEVNEPDARELDVESGEVIGAS